MVGTKRLKGFSGERRGEKIYNGKLVKFLTRLFWRLFVLTTLVGEFVNSPSLPQSSRYLLTTLVNGKSEFVNSPSLTSPAGKNSNMKSTNCFNSPSTSQRVNQWSFLDDPVFISCRQIMYMYIWTATYGLERSWWSQRVVFFFFF